MRDKNIRDFVPHFLSDTFDAFAFLARDYYYFLGHTQINIHIIKKRFVIFSIRNLL
jgi:hypothetical protein